MNTKIMKIITFCMGLFMISIFSSNVFADDIDFITTWKTNNPGTSNSTSITIPTLGGGYSYNVDWDNNGVFDDLGVNGSITHDYGIAGTYQVRIQGIFPRIFFNNAGDKLKIISIDQWGATQWSSMSSAFNGCSNLTYNAIDLPDLSLVADMSYMFNGATSFNGDVGSWDVSHVTNMYAMFNGAASFNQDISSWDVSHVTNMGYMFNNATVFNQNLNSWDISSVTDMSYMFAFAYAFNQDITSWNPVSATNMFAMFSLTPFNQDISSWNVGSVTNMGYMFYLATSFNQDISSWNVGSVTNMISMFNGATSFNQDISSWNVGSVTNIYSMFSNATSFNQDISSWDVSHVITMNSMFNGATSFNQDISSWNVGSVTNMSSMFSNATSFNQDISSWNISNVADMSFMFAGDTLSQANYDSILIGWSSQGVKNNVPFHGGNSTYCNGSGARTSLVSDYGWIITDGGYNCQDTTPPLVTLSGDVLITMTQGDIYDEHGAMWSDDVDGTGFVLTPFSGVIDTSLTGTYLLYYTYIDTSGNTGNIVVRTVNVLPIITPPVINIGGGFAGGSPFIDIDNNTGTTTLLPVLSGDDSVSSYICLEQDTEVLQSYCFAKSIGSTTMDTFPLARYNDSLTRAELSKIVAQYVIVFLNKPEIPNIQCKFKDIHLTAQGDLKSNIIQACNLGLMGLSSTGRPLINFRPNDLVTRAEYVTVLSRVIYYNNKYDIWNIAGDTFSPFYTHHMTQLLQDNMITTIQPLEISLRDRAFLAIYRLSQSKSAEIN